MNSLEATQASGTSAAQGLATGTITDPTQAITAVENASLSMDQAAQIRDKLVSAENTIFQTQV
jgi:flagellar hook-basal body complex protein FliE